MIWLKMNHYFISQFKAIGPSAWFRTWLHKHMWKHKTKEWCDGKVRQEVERGPKLLVNSLLL